MASSITSTSDLRKMLIETIEGVRTGVVEPAQASAIARLSTQILQSAKLDLDVVRFNIANKDAGEAGTKVLQLISA